MLEEDLRNAMLANSAVHAAVGTRFTEGSKPQSEGYPCVTFARVSTQDLYSHSGRTGLRWARVTLNCWALDPADARDVAGLLVAALPTFNLTLAPESPPQVLTTSPNFVFGQWADEWPDPEPTVYRERLDVKIWFRE